LIPRVSFLLEVVLRDFSAYSSHPLSSGTFFDALSTWRDVHIRSSGVQTKRIPVNPSGIISVLNQSIMQGPYVPCGIARLESCPISLLALVTVVDWAFFSLSSRCYGPCSPGICSRCSYIGKLVAALPTSSRTRLMESWRRSKFGSVHMTTIVVILIAISTRSNSGTLQLSVLISVYLGVRDFLLTPTCCHATQCNVLQRKSD
jgi:hypothetical protein